MLFDSFITAQLGYWDNCCYACLEFNFSKIFLSSGAAKFYARLKLMYPVIFRRVCLPQLASMKKLWRWRARPPNLARMKKLSSCLPLFSLSGYVVRKYMKFFFLLPTNVQLYIVDMVQMFVNLLIQRSPVTGYTRHYYWHLQAIYGNLSPIFICHYCLE